MNTIYWLAFGYGFVFASIGGYLAFLGIRQKRSIEKLEDLERN